MFLHKHTTAFYTTAHVKNTKLHVCANTPLQTGHKNVMQRRNNVRHLWRNRSWPWSNGQTSTSCCTCPQWEEGTTTLTLRGFSECMDVAARSGQNIWIHCLTIFTLLFWTFKHCLQTFSLSTVTELLHVPQILLKLVFVHSWVQEMCFDLLRSSMTESIGGYSPNVKI